MNYNVIDVTNDVWWRRHVVTYMTCVVWAGHTVDQVSISLSVMIVQSFSFSFLTILLPSWPSTPSISRPCHRSILFSVCSLCLLCSNDDVCPVKYGLLPTQTVANAWVRWSSASVNLYVCVGVGVFVNALKGNRLELSTPNVVHIIHGRTSACSHSEVKRSRSRGYQNLICCRRSMQVDMTA